MKKSVRKMIQAECDKFAGVFELSEVKRARLEKLAMQSYENLPAKQKSKWSLEAIVKQGL